MLIKAPKIHKQAILVGRTHIMLHKNLLGYLVLNFGGLLDRFREFGVKHLRFVSEFEHAETDPSHAPCHMNGPRSLPGCMLVS